MLPRELSRPSSNPAQSFEPTESRRRRAVLGGVGAFLTPARATAGRSCGIETGTEKVEDAQFLDVRLCADRDRV
jgi:hypothetical protein